MKSLTKAIIPVAGLGTRMLPATKAIPKELLPIVDRPIIEYVVKEAIDAGITEIILVTRTGKEAIENHFDINYELEHRLEKKGKETILRSVKDIIPNGINITSIRQQDALGLGHAVLCAKHLLNDEPFAVLLPDVLVLDKITRENNYSFKAMYEAWNNSGIGQIMVERINAKEVENYGIVDLDNINPEPFTSTNIKTLVEKPSIENSPSNLAVLGRYILPPSIMGFLENTKAGVGGEIQLTDALDMILKENKLNAFLTDGVSFDCGNKRGFLGANLTLGMRDNETKEYIEDLNKKDFK